MHNHSHSHSHSHGKDDRIGWTFFLNVSFTIIEFIGLTASQMIMRRYQEKFRLY